MENVNNWYFTKEQLANSPSRRTGIDFNRELSYRQQAANFIQDMGQRLQVSQLCINTAIVYMHRFYVFHSFSDIHRNNISTAALFLAAKVEEQPRKLEHVIKVAHVCLHKDASSLDVRSEAYSERMNEVVFHENLLLQTLGFVLAIEHPHTYVVKVSQLVKASKDLAQTSYIMATTSLHMTTMCLMYKPTLVACVCIHLACKWSSYMIEPCSEGRDWFYYVDRNVTKDLLEKLTQEYISILERSPHRFKKKFAKDAASGYHGPSSISMDESTLRPSDASTSYDLTDEKPPRPASPPKHPSPTFEFDFDEKQSPQKPPRPPSPAPSNNHHHQREPPTAVRTEKKHHRPPEDIRRRESSNHHPKHAKAEEAPKPPEAPLPPAKPPREAPPPLPSPPPTAKTNGGTDHPKRRSPEGRHKHKKSSRDHHRQQQQQPPGGIKVKIRMEDIAEPPQPPPPSLKIKLPKPPPPCPLKLVLTKDKSGSGSYSAQRKRRQDSHASSEHKRHRPLPPLPPPLPPPPPPPPE